MGALAYFGFTVCKSSSLPHVSKTCLGVSRKTFLDLLIRQSSFAALFSGLVVSAIFCQILKRPPRRESRCIPSVLPSQSPLTFSCRFEEGALVGWDCTTMPVGTFLLSRGLVDSPPPQTGNRFGRGGEGSPLLQTGNQFEGLPPSNRWPV